MPSLDDDCLKVARHFPLLSIDELAVDERDLGRRSSQPGLDAQLLESQWPVRLMVGEDVLIGGHGWVGCSLYVVRCDFECYSSGFELF